MPASWRRGDGERVGFVVVERDGVDGGRQAINIGAEDPTPTTRRILRRTKTRRQMPASSTTGIESDDDDESDYEGSSRIPSPTTRPFTIPSATPIGTPAFAITSAAPDSEPTNRSPANKGPSETGASSLIGNPEQSMGERQGGISQTTEHLLIAAGSIGATIVIVMIVLGLYTMRKRGISISDVIRNGKGSFRRGGPPLPPKYDMDSKQGLDHMYVGNVYPPRQAAMGSRSGSLSTQTPLHPLARSDSFKPDLDPSTSAPKTFLLDPAPPSRQNSHRRDISATPSSPLLPIQDTRQSNSTHNTRSIHADEEALAYPSAPPRQLSALPAPPTFRQFLSNRPSASQRPLPGASGGMMSRFSWTNSNAPQTPHDPTRDTALAAAQIGRDSFMTTRSSVPRFRTIDSWVNQQSTRIEEQRLKQQFRMTSSTTYSEGDGGDVVPEMPPVPENVVGHRRHDTVDTAPIFKQHPGTEVRFSTRSTVPSEILDAGRRNVAL